MYFVHLDSRRPIMTGLATILIILCLCSPEPAAGRNEDSHTSTNSDRIALLTWEAPRSFTSGKPLDNLAGYIISYGTKSGKYLKFIKVPLDSHDLCCKAIQEGKAHGTIRTECRYVVLGLGRETHYFAVKAYTQSGSESDYSNEVRK